MPKRFAFTKTLIEELPIPAKREYVYDTKMPGLALALQPSGARVFYVYRKIDGKPERIRLAKWPEIDVDNARKAATRILGAIAGGANPGDERRSKRHAPTLQEAFDIFIQGPTRTKAKRTRSKVTIEGYTYILNNYLDDWRGRNVAKITRHEIEKKHNAIAESVGQYAANRTLAVLKAVYNSLIDEGTVEANPATRIRKFEEHARDRFLQPDELPRFWKALHAEPSKKIQDFILMALFTGQRHSNVRAMRWDEVNLETKVWAMSQTKTGAHKVPLSDEAVAILKWRRKRDPDGEWVFPARRGSGHLQDIWQAWKRLKVLANIPDLRFHDLRRTLGSWQTITGASRPIVGKMLGHTQEQTTAIYGRLNMKPVRDSLATATAAILQAAKKRK